MSRSIIWGANSAIAEEYAKLRAQEKFDLVLIARSPEKLSHLAKILKDLGAANVDTITWDANDFAAIPQVSQQAFHKPADEMLFAYGSIGEQSLAIQNPSQAKEILDINFNSVVAVIESSRVLMKTQKNFVLKVITSVAGERPRASNYFYSAAKGALSLYLSGLMIDPDLKSIQIFDIKPGYVDTPMTKNFKKGILFATPQKVARDIQKISQSKCHVIYTPSFWRWIMLVVRNLPQFLFLKIK